MEKKIKLNNQRHRKHTKKKQNDKHYPTVLFFSFLYFLINLIKSKTIPKIRFSNITFFQFSWDIAFLYNPDIFLVPFVPKNEEFQNTCKLCNFKPHESGGNSQPGDVIIGFVSNKVSNIVPFVRSLRTTKSKCSIVFLFDDKALNSIDTYSENLIRSCGAQIINWHRRESNCYIKNFMFQLVYSFIRLNQYNLNRIIVVDVYDTLFQSDPFNNHIPPIMMHITDERTYLKHSHTNVRYIERVEDYHYKVPKELLSVKYYCAGYVEGEPVIFLEFLNVFLRYVTNSRDIYLNDQGIINYCSVTGKFHKEGIVISQPGYMNSLIRHTAGSPTNDRYPDIRAINNISYYGSIVHHYYLLGYDTEAISAIVNACPRPNASFRHYLHHYYISHMEMIEGNIR